jgi:hypothetical protein
MIIPWDGIIKGMHYVVHPNFSQEFFYKVVFIRKRLSLHYQDLFCKNHSFY